jgi:hypothetical protein
MFSRFYERGYTLRIKFKPGDFLIILFIIITAILITFSFNNKNTTGKKIAVISQNNKILKIISLDDTDYSATFEYNGPYPGTIEIKEGRIRFLNAKCPDKVCVNTGWISRSGQIAVCLPAGVMIKIEGSAPDSDYDIIIN